MQGYSKQKTDKKKCFLLEIIHKKGNSYGNAYYSAGDCVEQCGSQESKLPREQSHRCLVYFKRLNQKEHIFQCGETQGRGNEIYRPVNRFTIVICFIYDDKYGKIFQYFFHA